MRASSRLIKAVRKVNCLAQIGFNKCCLTIFCVFLLFLQVYGDKFGVEEPQNEYLPENVKSSGRTKDRARNRKVSDQNNSQTSLRHKENINIK